MVCFSVWFLLMEQIQPALSTSVNNRWCWWSKITQTSVWCPDGAGGFVLDCLPVSCSITSWVDSHQLCSNLNNGTWPLWSQIIYSRVGGYQIRGKRKENVVITCLTQAQTACFQHLLNKSHFHINQSNIFRLSISVSLVILDLCMQEIPRPV